MREETNTPLAPSKRGIPPLLRQLVSFGLVGVVNTLITALVIWIALKGLGLSPVVSNVLGYVAGVLNSFVFNSRFTFKASLSWRRLRLFVFTFAVCYVLQLCMLLYLGRYTSLDPYLQQLAAMVVYNVANFCLNKWVTFRK